MFNRLRKSLICFSLLVLFFCVVQTKNADAATVYLKDGTTIQGTVVGATALEVQINSEKGLIRLNSNQIIRIDYGSDSSPLSSPTETSPSFRNHIRNLDPEERFSDENSNNEFTQIFSIDLGASSPLSRVDFNSTGGGSGENGNTGLLLGAQYLSQNKSSLAWGINVEWMNRGYSNSHALLPQANTRIFGDSLVILPVVKYSFSKRGWTSPYLLAGIGLNRTSTFIDARPEEGFSWSDTSTDETRTLVDDSRWGISTTARLGIDFFPQNPTFFSFELGWTGIHNHHYNTTAAAQDLGLESVTGNLSLFTVAGRWSWRF